MITHSDYDKYLNVNNEAVEFEGNYIVFIDEYDNAEGGAALFGELAGTVKNLTVNGYVYAKNGIAAGIAAKTADGAVIDTVTANMFVLTESSIVGGIVGKAGGSTTIKNTKFAGAVATVDAEGHIPSEKIDAVVGQIVADGADKTIVLDTCVAQGAVFTNSTANAFCAAGASALTKNACTEEASALNFDPAAIELRTVDDVRAFLSNPNETYEGKLIKLMNDIDLNPGWDATTTVTVNDGETRKDYTVTFPEEPSFKWNPLYEFKGTFDGQGYELKGLYINVDIHDKATNTTNEDGVGMFNMMIGTVKNIKITNALVIGTRSVASTWKVRVGTVAGYGRGTFENIYSDANVWAAQDGDFVNHGGIIGIAGYGTQFPTVKNCVYAGQMGSLNVATVVMGSEGANTGRNPNPFYGDIIGCAKNKNTETTSITNCLAIADRYGLSGNGDAFVAQNWYVTFTNNVDGKKDAAWLADPANEAYVADWEYNAVLGYVVPKTISEMFK